MQPTIETGGKRMPVLRWRDGLGHWMAGGVSPFHIPDATTIKHQALDVVLYAMPRLWLCARVSILTEEQRQPLWQTLPCYHFSVDDVEQKGNCLAVSGLSDIGRVAEPYMTKVVAFHFPGLFEFQEINLLDLMGSLPSLMAKHEEEIKTCHQPL